MEFLIIPVEDLKLFDPEWEYRRKSNDGTKALIHKEIYDSLVPSVMTLNLEYTEDGEAVNELQYPFPLVTADQVDSLDEFKSIEEII